MHQTEHQPSLYRCYGRHRRLRLNLYAALAVIEYPAAAAPSPLRACPYSSCLRAFCGVGEPHYHASAVTAELAAAPLAPTPAMDTSSYSTSDRL